MDKPYEPEVDDYVVWERETWVGIERMKGGYTLRVIL